MKSNVDAPANESDATCPWRERYDPLSAQVAGDPFALLAGARREDPVFFMPRYGMWCVTRYADAAAVMRTSETFSTSPYGEAPAELPAEVAAAVGVERTYVNPVFNADVLLSTSPPRHTRMRRAYQYAFTPKTVVRYADDIRATVDGLIDAFASDGRADLMAGIGLPLPIMVISEIIGLPTDRVDAFRSFFDAAFVCHSATLDPSTDPTDAWREVVAFGRFFQDFIDDRRAHPRDDLASEVVHARDDDGQPLLSDNEVFTGLAGLALAGGETTASLITNVVRHLLERPDQWAAVRADRTLIPAAIEESMRFHGPVSGALRKTLTDVVVAGTEIPAGSVIYVQLQSANRDDAEFADAATFDLTRDNAVRQLGFGISIHKCVGAPLARLEAQIALEQLIDRLPGLRLVDAPRDYHPQILTPRLASLPVAWDA